MTFELAAEARGLVVLLALLLWPGLLVVRAPWAAVPFLSLSFWLVSWWWLPSSTSRSAFLRAALLFFFLLSLLRLFKPWPRRRPASRTLVVMGLALACLLPVPFLPVAPGRSLASTEATLVVWRDGFPSTYEPLVPIRSFGAHAPGLPLLAADVSLLSGLAPFRAVVLVALGAGALLVLAVSMVLARAGRPHLAPAAAAALLAALALTLRRAAPGPAVLSAALGLAALGLLLRRTGRAPAVAAGALLGAAFTVEANAAALLSAASWAISPPARAALAVALALALCAPRLATSLSAWTPAEVLYLGRGLLSMPAGRLPDPAAMRAMLWLRGHSDPVARVCVAPEGPGRFLPSIAARATVPAEIPLVYREEAREIAASRSDCAYRVLFGPLDPPEERSIPASAPLGPAFKELFRDGSAVVLQAASPNGSITSFDNLSGNHGPARP